MNSEAVLISSSNIKNISDINIVELVKRFEGVINAAESKYVMLNADTNSIKQICKLPGADSPRLYLCNKK